ncbi:MAG: tetratricopeptide repeat protein [Thermodesulfobacteriota bacterium]
MKISAHILPRRVILALILALGWGLRYWGLAWGPDPAAATHPEEWTWQIIDALSFGSPTYPGLWTQAFYSLAALVRGAISTAAGWLGVWLGEVRTSTELILPAKLAGRVTVAFLGGLQVWMAYMVARRYFDSVATGLLAAAALAVSPVLVAQSHFLALDIPLGLAVMGCLWAAWWLANAPGAASLAVAGLALGLTITTKASGVLAAPVLAGAYVLAHRRGLPERWQWAAAWPLAFLGGLLGGLLLGYPGFLVRLPEVGDVISASFGSAGAPEGGWWTHLAERWRQVTNLLGRAVGLDLIGLWIIAAGVVLWRRQWQRLLLLVFPPLYLLAGLLLLKGSVEGQQAVWLPVAIMAACWPLVLLARRLPGRWLPVVAVSTLGFLLCVLPLWRSLGVGYLFWQQDTFSAARFWLGANLPAGAEVLAVGQSPPGLFPGQRHLGRDESPPALPAGRVYLLTSALGPDGDPCQDAQGAAPAGSGWQLLQAFDLRAGLGGGQAKAPCFPRWVSPRVEVYATLPSRPVTQPLALWRPGVGSDRGYALVHGDHTHYSRAENNFWLQGPGLAQRVLRLCRPPEGLDLEMHNAGQDLALVQVSQGLLPGRLVTIYPGQELRLPLGALNWPPMAQGFYPVRVVLRRGGGVLARLEWDPLLRGRRALEHGAFALAAIQLQRAARLYPDSFEAQAMLAGALARLGRHEQAGAALAALSASEPDLARTYLALADGPQPGGQAAWEARFSAFTGYHYALLRQATSLTYRVGGPACQSESGVLPLAGDGFHGSLDRPAAGQAGGSLRLWLEEPLPSGRFAVELDLALKGAAPAGDLAQVEVWGQDQQGSRRLAARVVRSADLAGEDGAGRVRLPIALEGAATRLELRLHYLGPQDLRLMDLTVGADLPAHLRQISRWYHDAWGRVALAAGRHQAAVASFEALLALDPGFSAAYLPLAQALLSAGRLEAATRQAFKAEQFFADQPEELILVRDLYALLQRPADQARVEQRLADLRPSLKREARFANGLSLLGYDLSAGEARAGSSLDLGYYWQVWSQPPLNYYIFVHLKGQDKILTFDHLLDHGRRDMTGLKPGQVVRENYRVTIPATARPGRYQLLVGMWDPRYTGQRVPVAEGEGEGSDEVLLATLEVK